MNYQSGFAKFSIFFGFIMIGFYAIVGLLLIFTQFLGEMIGNYRPMIGGLLLCYAGFRFYMNWKMFQRMKEQGNSEQK